MKTFLLAATPIIPALIVLFYVSWRADVKSWSHAGDDKLDYSIQIYLVLCIMWAVAVYLSELV